MAGITLVENLRLFQQELRALKDGYGRRARILENDYIICAFEKQIGKVFDATEKETTSCSVQKLGSDKLSLDGVEYDINDQFQQDITQLADEVGTDEADAAQCLLESQDDPSSLGRSLLDCARIRFLEQRKLFLGALRLILELEHIARVSENTNLLETIDSITSTRLLQLASKRVVSKCMSAMSKVKAELQKFEGRKVAAHALPSIREERILDELEIVEAFRTSLIQQHEALSVILCYLIERGQATAEDFLQFAGVLKKVERYDVFLVHSMSVLGAFISIFGPSKGGQALSETRYLNSELLSHLDDASWALIELRAAVQAWWLAEHCSFYIGNNLEEAVSQAICDQEDRDKSKQFHDALKAGAFDFLLTVVGDVQPSKWHDPSRASLRYWLRRKTPALAVEPFQVSASFYQCLMSKIEGFADAFISNFPDVLRKLRVEEDEQRQFSQTFEQDLDLERFLLIIAYCYEGRPDAAANFWSDPDNNLAGFLHWASRRASAPLMTAFCEVLQAISEKSQWATAAHEFLLDDGHHSSGKIRRSQSLTWSQIFKELDFFTDSIRQKPTISQSVKLRGASLAADQIEAEPETIMMLECYLRLMAKLAQISEAARLFLLQTQHYNLVDVLLELACGPIPSRLRGYIFLTLSACMSRKTLQESYEMWVALENWVNGAYSGMLPTTLRQPYTLSPDCPERILKEMSIGFEVPLYFTDLLNTLVMPAMDSSPLHNVLPFPQTLGSATRHPGIELYVDYVMGAVLVKDPRESTEPLQCRLLRLKCLDFILSCLTTFNENLITILKNPKFKKEAWLSKTDLETYLCAHPFARIMDWMLHSDVNNALFSTIHQNYGDVGNAVPDSPLILSILRAVQVMTKVLDLETTYQELVQPVLKERVQRNLVSEIKADHVSFAVSLQMRPKLSVDLGIFCGFGHSDLTLSCLKLLTKISASDKNLSTSSVSERNPCLLSRTILAFQAKGEHDFVARSFASELMAPLDLQRESDSPDYTTKLHILDFLIQSLSAFPNLPSISHLFLGLSCGADALFVTGHGQFAAGKALFHCLLRLMMEVPSSDEQGMRHWLLAIKVRVMQILRMLWSSPISAPIVLTELREHGFFLQLLVCEQVIHRGTLWEGKNSFELDFLHSLGAPTLMTFLALRGLIFDYLSLELCSVSQKGAAGEKKRLFSALNGGVYLESAQALCTPTIFDFYDFQVPEDEWGTAIPESLQFRDIEILYSAIGVNSAENFNLDVLKDILRMRRVGSLTNAVVTAQELIVVEKKEELILEHLIALSRKREIIARRTLVLKSWIDLLLIMIESNNLQGSAKKSLYLQSLQTILPSLAKFASTSPDEAEELAMAARVLVLDKTMSEAFCEETEVVGFCDKFYQLFSISLSAIGEVNGSPRFRSTFYDICYRFLTIVSTSDSLQTYRRKASKTICLFGDRVMNAICDDAFCGEPKCQAAALSLLKSLIDIETIEGDYHAVEAMNQRNFICILVDSLQDKEQHNLQNARMSLLLQLAKKRSGAKLLFHANLFRIFEMSGLFNADLLLRNDLRYHGAIEQHFKLQAQVCRILGAALLSRGNHNVKQGQRFLAAHRLLVAYILKRTSDLPNGGKLSGFGEGLMELADTLIVIIIATGFLEVGACLQKSLGHDATLTRCQSKGNAPSGERTTFIITSQLQHAPM